jgi:hypothetical protein
MVAQGQITLDAAREKAAELGLDPDRVGKLESVKSEAVEMPEAGGGS